VQIALRWGDKVVMECLLMIRVILGLCAMKLLGQEMHEKLTTPCPVSIAMNTHDTDELPQESPRVPTTFPSNDDAAKIPIPAWRRHVHLYAPIIGSIFAIMFSPTISQILRLPNGLDRFAVVASFAIPTYLAASTFYPSNRPEPTPKQSIRFTRKNDLYRAAVLATYGRIFDEPSDVIPYLMDVLLNYGADQLVGERPTGTKQRRSEFLVALLWIIGSRMVGFFISFDTPASQQAITLVNRTLNRTSYVALVDDVVGVLTLPNIRTLKGKMTVIMTQAFVILTVVISFISWAQGLSAEQASIDSGAASEL
jgi:hypothetical protein